MDVRRPLMHAAIVTTLEASSPQFLLQQGITAITQGRYSEGIALLVRARDTLILEQPQYLLLDTIMQHYTRYTQAQEALLDASRTFAQADSDLHTSIADLEQLLLQNEQEAQSLSSTIEQLLTRQKTASLLPMPTGNTIHEETDKRATSTNIEKEYLPELSITCFGRFEVRRRQQAVTLCQNRNGQAIFRYLVAQPGYRATMDALIEAFWPDEDPGVARRKLQIAISALRPDKDRSHLPGCGHRYARHRRRYRCARICASRISSKSRISLQQAWKSHDVLLQAREPKVGIVKLVHFGDGLRRRLVFDGDAVSSDHGACPVRSTLAMNKNLRLRVGPDQVQEF